MTTAVVTAMDDAGHNTRAQRLQLDGTERVIASAVVKELDLCVGCTVDLATLSEAEMRLARERGLRLLSARERSVHDLETRLTTDGYPAHVVEEISRRFAELALVDDDRFARMLARSRIRSGYGPRRVIDDLRRHGIDESVAAATLGSLLADDDMAVDAEILRVVERVAPQTREERERLIRRLVRRGFDLSTILSALEEHTRRNA